MPMLRWGVVVRPHKVLKDVDVLPSLVFRQVAPHARLQRSIEPFDDTRLGLLVVRGEMMDAVLLQCSLNGTMEPLQSYIVPKEGLGKLRKSHTSDDPIVKYTNEYSLRLEPAQKKLIDITLKHSMAIEMGSADEIQLLQNLCRSIDAKKTLDIGVYTGYSAMSIAMVLPPDGVVVACDTTDQYANMGKPFWKEAGVLHKIDLRIAPAKETLTALVDNGEGQSFDFAFIDANNDQYDDYYELCIKLVRPGGIIALDNMILGGRVIYPTYTDSEIESTRALNRKMAVDERINVSFVNIGDGTMLAFKK